MQHIWYNFKTINKVEKKLNLIKYDGLELGNLLSAYFTTLTLKKFNRSFIKKLFLFFFYLIIPFSKEKVFKNRKKKILYFSSGSFRHLKQLSSVFLDNVDIKIKTLFISNKNNKTLGIKIFYLSDISDFINVFSFLKSNIREINKIIKILKLPFIFKIGFFIELQMQLLRSISLLKFVKSQKNTKIICADFDRGYESALFFAVAKSLKKDNFTIQHGSFNFPNIYNLNSDEYWVWGAMAKEQLKKIGYAKKKIVITGSPIIQNIRVSQSERKKFYSKTEKNVILALSSKNKKDDLKLVKFLYNLKKINKNLAFNFFVKIHPARNYNNYKWIKRLYGIDILPKKISYEKFMNTVDILLTHSSDIACETLFFGKKVIILDILDFPARSNLELKKYFKIKFIKKPIMLKNINFSKSSVKKEFLYYKTGDYAKIEIQKNIIKKLKHN